VLLLVDHGPLITSRGVIMHVGIVRRFAAVTYPTHGQLILAEVDHAAIFGNELLTDLVAVTSQTWLPTAGAIDRRARSRRRCAALRGQRHKIARFRRRESFGCRRRRDRSLDVLTERRIVADRW
jgi:hypothetical protein